MPQACPACHRETIIPEAVLDAIRDTKIEQLDNADPLGALGSGRAYQSDLRTDVQRRRRILEGVLCDTSHPLFALLRASQDHALTSSSSDALPLASRVAGAMEQLYPRGHPVRSVQLATVAKLMLNASVPSPQALFVLRKALEELEIGFGPGGGEAGEQVKGMLADCEIWLRAGGAQGRA
jgi:hypothetical protein